MSALLFIAILLVLVLIHEAGHFFVAKLFRIRVDEFAFGFPPRLFSITKGETRYAFNLFPIGGYVKIFGESPDDLNAGDQSRSFAKKPLYVQSLVIVAGVMMNWLLAWAIIWVVLIIGIHTSAYDVPKGQTLEHPTLYVSEVVPESPAALAGVEGGDTVVRLEGDGAVLDGAKLTEIGAFSTFVGAHPTSTLSLSVLRGATSTLTLPVTPKININPQASSTPAIGVLLDIDGVAKYPFVAAGIESFHRTVTYTKLTAVGLYGFFKGIVTGHADLSQVTGPVGLVKVVGQAAGIGIVSVLMLVALISINLSIINLIPFPALDGGRFLFIVIESVIRRPISPTLLARVNTIGFVLLILLMILVTYHDIVKV